MDITWTLDDTFPYTYDVLVRGTSIYGSLQYWGAANNEITVSMDGLNVAIYSYTMLFTTKSDI